VLYEERLSLLLSIDSTLCVNLSFSRFIWRSFFSNSSFSLPTRSILSRSWLFDFSNSVTLLIDCMNASLVSYQKLMSTDYLLHWTQSVPGFLSSSWDCHLATQSNCLHPLSYCFCKALPPKRYLLSESLSSLSELMPLLGTSVVQTSSPPCYSPLRWTLCDHWRSSVRSAAVELSP
jgi:hypothetical protein